MSDETELNGMEPIESTETPTPVASAPKATSSDFLSTTPGRVVLIGAAVLVLLVIAGVVGYFVLGPASMGTGTPGAPTVVVPTTGTPAAPAAPAVPTSSTVATLPVADITSRDVFTPRNPFTPLSADKIVAETASSDGTSTTTTRDPDDVILTRITTVGGVRKAVIAHGGTTQTLGVGDAITGHPTWKITAVNASSVVVLFDDVSVTLTVGESTTK